MRFGLFIPQGWRLDLVGIEPGDHWAVMRDLATYADDSAWDSLWVYDHFHTVPMPTGEATHEAWSLMSAYAATTSRIKLGQMCTAMSYRNPVYLAKVAATADIISGGRIQMGIGGGWYEHEWRAYGYGFPSAGVRLGRLDEGVQIMRDAWRDGMVSFDGQALPGRRCDCGAEAVAGRRDSTWIAGGGEKVTLRIAAKYAQYTNFTSEPEGFAHKSEVLADHCREVGTDFGAIVRSANINAVVGTSEADVKDRLDRVRDRHGRRRARGRRPTRCSTDEQRTGLGTGTPEQLVEQLAEDARPRLRVRDLLFPGGRIRPVGHRAVRAGSDSRAELDVASGVPGLDRRRCQQWRQLGHPTFAGTKLPVGLVVLDRLPEFVDDPVGFIVLIGEHVGAQVPIERPGDLQGPAHEVAGRGHRFGFESELE